MGYIYKITNTLNQKSYIGQTITKLSERFAKHKYLANHPEQQHNVSYIHRAIHKYGIENFTFETVEQIDNSLLNEREKYWIQYYNTFVPDGYNLTKGGDGTAGFSRPQSEEEKKQRSESLKQYYKNHPEAKEKIGKRTSELWKNPEYRRKVTQSNKEFYKNHPDMFKGKNNPMYGKHHTEQALKKIRAHAAKQKLKIAQLDKETLETIQEFDGIRDAERALNVSHGWIAKAARQDKVAYGFRWKFL